MAGIVELRCIMITLLYSGNFGLGHELDTMLRAVHVLRDEVAVRLLLVGAGGDIVRVRQLVAMLRLANTELRPPVPLDQLWELLASGDIHIVTQKPSTEGLIVPSKIYGTLAAGRPTIFVGPERCDVAEIVRRSASGFVVAPGDVPSAGEALRQLATNAALRQEMGRRAKDYYRVNLGRRRSVSQIIDIIEQVGCNGRSCRAGTHRSDVCRPSADMRGPFVLGDS
jgi:colanic acid biosynthesis glycosyl transferase WcaI